MTHPGTLIWLFLLLWAPVARAQPGAAPMRGGSPSQQNGQEGPELGLVDRLRAQLAQPGGEGQDQRAMAIERLLSLPDEAAHAVLQARLADADDPDGVRWSVLQALVRRLLNPADPVFGEFEDIQTQRARLVRGYGRALVPFWLGKPDADGLLAPDPLRDQARACLVRMPVRPLAEGLRAVAQDQAAPLTDRAAALRAAGDTQNLHFGALLADFVAVDEPQLRRAARVALRYLTFAEDAFESREQFEAWFQRNGGRRYLELAEEAARLGARRARQHREELLRVQREASSQIVRALTERRTGIDWAAVQQRTLVDDPGTVRACLLELRQTMADRQLSEDGQARQAFARAVLQRYRGIDAEAGGTRALMLEVTAYLVRPTEVDLANELAAELLVQLGADDPEMQLAALRGLRRFPSPEARAAVVRLGAQAMQRGEAADGVLSQVLLTLSTGGDSPWRAPAEGAADRAAWLELVRGVATGAFPRDRRNEALEVAMQLDREQKRVAEVFDMLLGIANDPTREPPFRTACLIRLQAWRDQPGRASLLVQAHTQLLGDADRDVRLFVAEQLTRLPAVAEDQRKQWLVSIVATLRDKLQTETNSAVRTAMLDCLAACSRDPGTPEAAIGALNVVLDTLGVPVPPDQQQRADQLLTSLTTIAADPRAEVGHWLNACDVLLKHERRAQLRHVLETHNAVLFAKDARAGDTALSQPARMAMRFLLRAALLKPAREPWQSGEANDVRIAFEALPPGERLPENLQDPAFRLLRLDALLACGKSQEVLALGNAWIEEKDPQDHRPLSSEDIDSVRLLMTEAYLLEGKIGPAADSLSRLGTARAADPRAIDAADRLGRAFLATDPKQAVRWLETVVRVTAEEDPAWRARAVALWQARVQANPADRDAVRAEIEKRAAMFDSPDCPEGLKNAVAVLRGTKNG
ncbi:MAG: hypothetical protein AB7O97_21680 [Planctomycetota bacterium]